MKNIYILKVFDFIASANKASKLALVVLLFFLSWGNGFAQTYTTNDVVGSWTNDASWSGGIVPSTSSSDNYQITINGTITYNGDITFSSNFNSLTIVDTLIVEGSLIFSGNGSVTIGNGGLLIVEGTLNHSDVNGTFIINSGGRLVVYEDATIGANMTISGELNVSGDFTYDTGNGRNFTLNSTGVLIVGGDLSLGGGNVQLYSGSYIGVLGDATFSSNNLPTAAGEVDVEGTTSGSQSTVVTVTDDITSDDPIYTVEQGMDVIAYISTVTDYTNSTGSAYTGVIWESDTYSTGCYLNAIVSGEITFSGGNVYFEYSVDGGQTWNGPIGLYNSSTTYYRQDDISTPSRIIQIRIRVANLPSGGTVSYGNITIAATNEGAVGANPITWDGTLVTEVCPTETATYTISNASDYESFAWSITSGSGTIVGDDNESSCTVKWTSVPATLSVSAVGGSCGGESSSVEYSISVTQSDELGIELVSKTNVSCYGGSNGAITVKGKCGENSNYSYSWQDNASITTATRSGLSAGTYTVTVTTGSQSASLDVEITEPDQISFSLDNIVSNVCDTVGGAFDVVVSGGNTITSKVTYNGGTTQIDTTGLFVSFYYRPDDGANLADYQLPLTVPNEGTMPANFSGVSFTDASGDPLYYWRESYTSNVSANYWVKLPVLKAGKNVVHVVWGSNATASTYNDFTQVFNQGGLNVFYYLNYSFDGIADTCYDYNNLYVLNKTMTNGTTTVCSTNDGNGASVVWEGWLAPPASPAYYGLMTGTATSDSATVYLNSTQVIPSSGERTTDEFAKTATTVSLSTYSRIRYEYTLNDLSSNGYAKLGYSTSDPAAFSNMTVIPRDNYYYRTTYWEPDTDSITWGLRFEDLAAGTYTVTITDSKGCTATGGNTKTVDIETDTQDPVLTDLPADYWTSTSSYNTSNVKNYVVLNDGFSSLDNWEDNSTNDLITISSSDLLYEGTSSSTSDYIVYTLDAKYYQNIRLLVTAYQSGSTWTANDFLRVDVDYNTGTWEQLFIDRNTWTGVNDDTGSGTGAAGSSATSDTIRLVDGSSGTYSQILIRIYFSTESALNYYLSSFKIVADQVGHLISPTVSGQPLCTDDKGCSVSYTDGDITWYCYNSTDPSKNEFSYVRTWTAVDSCGKTDTHDQTISVGTPPVPNMTSNRDTIFDFCYNTQSITAPAATDGCSSTVTVSYVITDKTDGDTLSYGDGSISDFVFPVGDTLDIAWSFMDLAGTTTTSHQQIIVEPVITASFVIPDNICAGETVAFVVTPTGGTGSFNSSCFDPSGGTWNSSGGTYTYSTSWASFQNTTLSVTITDLTVSGSKGVVGGCSTLVTSDSFDVHKLLQTQTISRD